MAVRRKSKFGALFHHRDSLLMFSINTKRLDVTGSEAIGTLRALAKASRIPLVKKLGTAALRVLGVNATFREHTSECEKLTLDVHDIVGVIIRQTVHISERELGEALKSDLIELLGSIDTISSFMEELASKPALWKMARRFTDEKGCTIKACEDHLERAWKRFNLQSQIVLRNFAEAQNRRTEEDALQSDSSLQSFVSNALVPSPKRPASVAFDLDDLLISTSVDPETSSHVYSREELPRKKRNVVTQIQGLSEQATATSSTVDSARMIPSLPPPPAIFIGRGLVIEQVIGALLSQPEVLVAILGPPGIGKTAVACTVLHEPRIRARFGWSRFFINGHKLSNAAAIVSSLAFQTGLGNDVTDPHVFVTLLQQDTQRPPSLFVFDDLETIWDAVDPHVTREVEELLIHMARMNNCALVVTMRGSEPPLDLSWKEFCLLPLHLEASCELYMAMSNKGYFAQDVLDSERVVASSSASLLFPRFSQATPVCRESSELGKYDTRLVDLVRTLDGIPMVIRLMAAIGRSEPNLQCVIERWKNEGTAMLFMRNTPWDSMDVSIQLSLQCGRMKDDTEALLLLSLTSLLPKGLNIQRMSRISPKLSRCKRAANTLIRAGLAYRRVDSHFIRVLFPIRNTVVRQAPLPRCYFSELLEYHTALAKVKHPDRDSIEEFENTEAVLLQAVSTGHDLDHVSVAVFRLLSKWRTRAGSSLIRALIKATTHNGGSSICKLLGALVQMDGSHSELLRRKVQTAAEHVQLYFQAKANPFADTVCGLLLHILQSTDPYSVVASLLEEKTALNSLKGVVPWLNSELCRPKICGAAAKAELWRQWIDPLTCLSLAATVDKVQESLVQLLDTTNVLEHASILVLIGLHQLCCEFQQHDITAATCMHDSDDRLSELFIQMCSVQSRWDYRMLRKFEAALSSLNQTHRLMMVNQDVRLSDAGAVDLDILLAKLLEELEDSLQALKRLVVSAFLRFLTGVLYEEFMEAIRPNPHMDNESLFLDNPPDVHGGHHDHESVERDNGSSDMDMDESEPNLQTFDHTLQSAELETDWGVDGSTTSYSSNEWDNQMDDLTPDSTSASFDSLPSPERLQLDANNESSSYLSEAEWNRFVYQSKREWANSPDESSQILIPWELFVDFQPGEDPDLTYVDVGPGGPLNFYFRPQST